MVIDPEKAHLVQVRIVERAGWEAAEPAGPVEPFPLPAAKAILWYYSTDTNPCHDDDQCARTVREIQKRHMDQGLPDIAYNFLVGGDGTVYEGRGWRSSPSKLLDKHRHLEGKSLDIAYIGRFSDEEDAYPSMSHAAVKLLNTGILTDLVEPTFRLVEENSVPEGSDYVGEPLAGGNFIGHDFLKEDIAWQTEFLKY